MFYLSSFNGSKPQKGICLLPKLAGDVMKCEVARLVRNTGDTLEFVSMIVPRKVRKAWLIYFRGFFYFILLIILWLT
jgi:hypothetical protein